MIGVILSLGSLSVAFVLALMAARGSVRDATPERLEAARRQFRHGLVLLFVGTLIGIAQAFYSNMTERERERIQTQRDADQRSREAKLVIARRKAEEQILDSLRVQLGSVRRVLAALDASERMARERNAIQLRGSRRAATVFDSVVVELLYARVPRDEPGVAEYMRYMATAPDPAFTRSGATKLPHALQPFVAVNGVRVRIPPPEFIEIGIFKRRGPRCDYRDYALRRPGIADFWLPPTKVEAAWTYTPRIALRDLRRDPELGIFWELAELAMIRGSGQEIISFEDLREGCVFLRMESGSNALSAEVPAGPAVMRVVRSVRPSLLTIMIRGRRIEITRWHAQNAAGTIWVAGFPPAAFE